MQNRFAQKMEDMRRLIDGSASVSQYLLAVSGGMDSMCMADLFLQTLGADAFAIAHCNFSLRGEESDGDEALVREWAENNGVRIFVKRFDTVSYARENGISIEMAARDLRYGWFAELCREHGFTVLSVAHNANDNAETLLLNLLRGTGLKGLHGMQEISGTLPVVVCRPLLEFTRKQIEGYVLTHRVSYRHDSSNFESDYKRNRIRNEVFPIFEKINPSFIRTLNREMDYFYEAEQIVADWCAAQLPSVLVVPSDDFASSDIQTEQPLSVMSSERSESRHLSISTLALLATPHWRYLLYYILEPYGFNPQTLSAIEALLESDRTISGKRFDSPTHVLLTGRDELKVLPVECAPVTFAPALQNDVMVIRGAGTYSFNGVGFTVEVLPCAPDMPLKQPPGVLIMDADKMKFPFVCRRWRQGDWLVPIGMKGKKKVSDMFADLKYDALAKDAAIILVDTQTEGLAEHQHIAGLLGVRIDDRYKVMTSTRTVLRISVITVRS